MFQLESEKDNATYYGENEIHDIVQVESVVGHSHSK